MLNLNQLYVMQSISSNKDLCYRWDMNLLHGFTHNVDDKKKPSSVMITLYAWNMIQHAVQALLKRERVSFLLNWCLH
ncbi:hypothetical protein LRAMOSA08974 [Lichtheimia ramosa]|uniref:Uncharacterized protein n=1 Tax=Lichtheimia ramosa TaxID=688394 RepID=A0A077WFP4_9FUNG|nr:hypothetical protein LRAMOSA08974 [Lichtheimia ramosa]